MTVAAPRRARTRVWVVPHTHWDREWYRPFQEFRLRLVELVDGLVRLLEEDLSFSHFVLDGQMAVVDDYLEIRPDAADSLRALAASGRLSMGPWYILMDEFLVSGETIVRDLQLGLRRASAFGGTMEVGYLPDMFGHIAQMPQILRMAGLDRAVVWRGVPRAVDRTRFVWSSPDGSEVLAEYLAHGYGNAAAIPADPAVAEEVVDGCIDEMERFSNPGRRNGSPAPSWGSGVLLMNGTDHQMPRPWLGQVVKAVNESQQDYELVVGSLAEALEDLTPGGVGSAPEWVPRWSGELRSSARANLLMGVASNRVDVKQSAAAAERSLERRAEPLWALFGEPERWPQAFLETAWKRMILNSAHDSVCACSDDEVVAAVIDRYAEARQIGDGLARRALEDLASSLSCTGAVVVNSSFRARSGVVQFDLPGEESPAELSGTFQVVARRPEVLIDATLDGATATVMIGEIRSQQISDDTFVEAIDIDGTSDSIEVSVRASSRLVSELPLEELKNRVRTLIESRPGSPVHISVTQAPLRTVLARPAVVPGYGWSRWEPAAPDHPATAAALDGGGAALSNGLVSVVVDPADGTFSVDGITGFNRLVDGGDHGDTYNYSPPRSDTVVDAPDSVAVSVIEAGPIRASVDVTRTYTWPERIDDSTRSRIGSRQVSVVSRLALHADELLVRVETTMINTCRDHRLRAMFPLAEDAGSSFAECAFGVVERPLVAEGGPTERGLATYPSRRFVTAGGVTVVHDGLLEYEVVGADGSSLSADADGRVTGGGAIALTLVRATGMLSRIDMTYRPLPAGPFLPLSGPQMFGPLRFVYAVALGPVDPHSLADDLLLPLEVVTSSGTGNRPPSGCALSVGGAEVSALRRSSVGGPLEIRVFDPRGTGSTVTVTGPDGRTMSGSIVDLRGREVTRFSGHLELAPWKIATLRLEESAGR